MVKFVRKNGKIGTLFWQVRYPVDLKWLNPLLKRVSSLPETWPAQRKTSQNSKSGLRTRFPTAPSTPYQPDGQDVRSPHEDPGGPQCQPCRCPQTHSDPPTLEGAGEEGFGQRHEAGDHRESSHGSPHYLAVKNAHGSKEIRQA